MYSLTLVFGVNVPLPNDNPEFAEIVEVSKGHVREDAKDRDPDLVADNEP